MFNYLIQVDISGEHYLYARCRQNDGGERLTMEDLNLCIANADGQLVAREGYNRPPLPYHRVYTVLDRD